MLQWLICHNDSYVTMTHMSSWLICPNDSHIAVDGLKKVTNMSGRLRPNLNKLEFPFPGISSNGIPGLIKIRNFSPLEVSCGVVAVVTFATQLNRDDWTHSKSDDSHKPKRKKSSSGIKNFPKSKILPNASISWCRWNFSGGPDPNRVGLYSYGPYTYDPI